MPIVRCRNDDGDCSYPARTLVVANGQLSVLTAAAAERLLTVDDSVDLEQLDLPAEFSYDDLVDMVLEARRAESPADGPPELLFGRRAVGQVTALEARLRANAAAAEDEDYVILNCSPCGHRFKKRIQR